MVFLECLDSGNILHGTIVPSLLDLSMATGNFNMLHSITIVVHQEMTGWGMVLFKQACGITQQGMPHLERC